MTLKLELYMTGYVDACNHTPDDRCLLDSQAYRDGYEAGIIDSDNLDLLPSLSPEMAVSVLNQ